MKRLFALALLGTIGWVVMAGSASQGPSQPAPILSIAAPVPATPAPPAKSQKLPPIDFDALHQRFGKADLDTSTAYDHPRPPLVTRTMVFNKHRLTVMMLVDGKIGDPPPYKGWLLVGLLDSKTGQVLSAEDVQRRLNESETQLSTKPTETTAKVVLTAAAIAAAIVQASRSAYYATGRPCACPDDVTRSGRRCGGNSAYSRPGGAQPLCYPQDVSTEMIEQYRQKKQASR